MGNASEVDEMEQAFGRMEECCKEWRAYLKSILNPEV